MTFNARVVVLLVLCSMLVVGAARFTAEQQSSRPPGVVVVKAAEVKWEDYPDRPGVQRAIIEGDLTKPGPFVMRVKFPAGYKLAPHTHPSREFTTVLSGGLRFGYGTNPEGPAELMSPGTLIITPANTPHFVTIQTETVVQTHGIGPWGSTPVK